jgi:hypothetical protein
MDVWVDSGRETAIAVAREINGRRELERDRGLPDASAVIVPHRDVAHDGQS